MKRYTIEGTIDLVAVAIERLKCFEEIALQMHPAGYYVAFSGGKDSDVIRILCVLAGVKHELWHNHTTVDAPETVRYVRSIPDININYPEMSMWALIVKKGFPPTRVARYCCEYLKEGGGKGRFVVTGVRKSESTLRADRAVAEIVSKNKKNKVVFTGDNDENKRAMYTCQVRGTRVLNPIVDWTDKDVWDFLHYHGCKSNPLYEERGYKRVGCIGCPMAQGRFGQLWEFSHYPKYKELYIRTFDKLLKEREYLTWKSGEEVFDWWTSGKPAPKQLEGQMDLLDFI